MNTNNRFSSRPSDLVPWADPYIARLVTALQKEVRQERSQTQPLPGERGSLQAELEPPAPTNDVEWDWAEEPRWTLLDDH